MRRYRKRSSITLLEILIVILLIGLVGGVLSYNFKGAMDRGKTFRTEEGIKRLKGIFDLELAQGTCTVDQLTTGLDKDKNIKACLVNSGLIPPNKVDDFLKDGWGKPYEFKKSEKNGELEITGTTK